MDSFETRRNDFHDLYDFDTDPGVTLAHLVHGAGDFLAEIVGPKNADPAMRIALGALGLSEDPEQDWREILEDNENGVYSEWPMGHLLHDLSAYAQYGIDLSAKPDEDEAIIEDRIVRCVASAADFLSRCPLDAWLGTDRAKQLEKTVAMARCRLALDRGEPVDPADLAELGDLSQSRMRSLVSGKTPELKREEGKIPARLALEWLEKRPGFLSSIWRSQRPEAEINEAVSDAEPVVEPLFVPRARDGSLFHPGLRAGGGFRIGPKGDERTVDSFREALAELQAMSVPYWRRPNAISGTPGIVRGEDWVRKSTSDFADDL